MECPLPVRRLGSRVVVELPAEIDLANGTSVGARLLGLLAPDVTALIVDMTGTTFCGSAGIAAVVGAYERARELGTWFCVATPNRQVLRIFELMALDAVVPIRPSVDDALTGDDTRAGETPPGSAGAPCDGAGPGACPPVRPRPCRSERRYRANPVSTGTAALPRTQPTRAGEEGHP